MRVLVVHTKYRQYGGEDRVVHSQLDLLSRRGHDVEFVEFANSSSQLESSIALASAPGNLGSRRRVAEAIRAHRPDIIHVHNTWFTGSPSVLTAAFAANVPAVLTLHNYRIGCPAATQQLRGSPCDACVGHAPIAAMRHRCVNNSTAQSTLAAITTSRLNAVARHHREQLRIVVPSETMSRFARHAGLPSNCVSLLEHYTDDPGLRPDPPSTSNTILYVGRLSSEKGVDVLVDAWRDATSPFELVIAGDGPLLQDLRRHESQNVTCIGSVAPSEAQRLMLTARAVVVPSVWDEPFGLTVVEALAAGAPVVASDVGSFASMIGAGGWVLPRADDHHDRRQLLREGLAALTDDRSVDERGDHARAQFEQRFSESVHAQALEQLYRDLIDQCGGR